MTGPAAPYVVMLIVVAAIMAVSAGYIWWRHRTLEAGTAAALLLAGAEWIWSYAFELAAADLSTKLFWNKVEYLGLVTLPAAWLVYTIQYTGREKWVTRKLLILLSVVPIATLLLVFTNEAHGLIWSALSLDASGSFTRLSSVRGPGSWVFAFYSYFLLLLGCVLLVQMLVRSSRFYRRRGGILLAGVFIPGLLSVLALLGLNPYPNPSLAPVSFATAGLLVVYGLFRLRRSDIVFAARGTIVEGMSDGVMVLDDLGRIMDLNPAAQQLLGRTVSDVLGQPVRQVWPAWRDQMARALDPVATDQEAVLLIGPVEPRIYDVRISPLTDWRGRLISEVVVLRDITERKRAEAERERLIQELQDALAQVKRLSGLLPICASCKKIRDDRGYWNQIEAYIQEHSEAEFTHGICPDCARKLYPQFFENGDETPDLQEQEVGTW